ncbi:MAG: transglutaminase family protein [Saprospiraceae bacterium]|nr:transglutaminase family protein [Lewinella sp.]
MKYRVIHQTKYVYQAPASLCHNMICQGPGQNPYQRNLNFDCLITPDPSYQSERRDFFENHWIYFAIQRPHTELSVKVTNEVELLYPDWLYVQPETTPPWESIRDWLQTTDAMNDTRQFYLESEFVRFIPGIREYAQKSFQPGRPVLEAMLELNERIHKDFDFTPGFTDISTPLEEVFEHRKGVCQDLSHFTLSCVRSLGLAARYISGYIETLPPPGKPKLVGADASHAWVAVFIPHLGWVEFDPTNNILVSDQHIRAAMGRDFADIVPLKGIVYSGGGQKMKVSVDVRKM